MTHKLSQSPGHSVWAFGVCAQHGRYALFAKDRSKVYFVELKTNAHQTYHHLASALARLGYLTTPEDLSRSSTRRPALAAPALASAPG